MTSKFDAMLGYNDTYRSDLLSRKVYWDGWGTWEWRAGMLMHPAMSPIVAFRHPEGPVEAALAIAVYLTINKAMRKG